MRQAKDTFVGVLKDLSFNFFVGVCQVCLFRSIPVFVLFSDWPVLYK